MSKFKPNIVFLLIDDMGWKDTGFMGSEYYETPNIDRLAQDGMVFTNAYANAPNCAPSRASLMTGQYTPRHGIYTVNSSARGESQSRKLIPISNNTTLSPENITIAEVLKKEGYVTGHIGKWHLGEGLETGPRGRGFDINIAGGHVGHPGSGYFSPYCLPDLDDGPEGEYLTDRLTDEALNFIDNNYEQPFFLYFSHYAIHTPIQAKEELINKYTYKKGNNVQNDEVYAAMIESTDQSVGRIMNKLEELDISDDTIVIFFSDNGALAGYKEEGIQWKEVTSNKPLRGGKGMIYEGGIREPMAVKWPGVVKPESVCDTPVMGIDFFPTLLDICSIEFKESNNIDGVSLKPLLKQEGAIARDSLFWHFPAYLEGNQGTWRTKPCSAVRKGKWKLIQFFEDDILELYNLEEDIAESNDLSKVNTKVTEELYQTLQDWREEIEAPVPCEKNPEYLK